MITFEYSGWFQCRLSLDTDPTDEKRGMVQPFGRCLPGEPDFDRIIRFHDPVAPRTYTPRVGVYVTNVIADNTPIPDHPLIGAKVNLEDNPTLGGFNGIVAPDFSEPILPFRISISKDDFYLSRKLTDEPPVFPFREYAAVASTVRVPIGIAEYLGIYNVEKYKEERIQQIQRDLAVATDETEIYCLNFRINHLRNIWAIVPWGRMYWNFPQLKGSRQLLGNTYFNIPDDQQWELSFWFACWDRDAFCGYTSGMLTLPDASLVTPAQA